MINNDDLTPQQRKAYIKKLEVEHARQNLLYHAQKERTNRKRQEIMPAVSILNDVLAQAEQAWSRLLRGGSTKNVTLAVTKRKAANQR